MSGALVCLPFAGGGAGFYRAWTDLPDGCPDIVPVQLPGREELFVDPPHTDAVTAAQALAPRIAELVGGYDSYALFGHSLGAVLAFEAARALSSLTGATAPDHLFVSGSPGPWSGRDDRATGLADREFLARVEQFAGYRHEALDDPEMRELLLPLLRADVEMHENYKPRSDEPLSVPVTSLRGASDTLVDAERAREWRHATTGAFRYAEIPGRHMYLVDTVAPLLETVTRVLAGRRP
ncbi:thioesterase [Streptomyces cinnamoneus]|uniref:Thioesterase n=1 Tax=Streptomyces cinnamoneus TaxID=53446 RepID=A0A2G1XNX7_STRCJ|nr:alpha/beta fold hydrolase [Streptomyces cinnamoneus]PHQ52955.1 thioesterase [Streptomyces cinnamoneus]PPT11383.1 thioesterase [Streptomyces cinnamoneus]